MSSDSYPASPGPVPPTLADDARPYEAVSKWPTTDELRGRLTKTIHASMETERFVLIPSPTSTGKSHSGATTRWRTTGVTGGTPVVHLHARKNSRAEAVELSETARVESRELLGGEEACGTFSGDYDGVVKTPAGKNASAWLYDQVVHRENTLSTAHSHLEEHNGGELPCFPCPSVEQWKDVPYDANDDVTADVIHATHNFSYVPSLVDGANLIFDERPDFKRSVGDQPNDDMTRSQFQDVITAWLKRIDAPVKSWELFVSLATDGSDALCELVQNPPSVDSDWFVTGEDAHALAPALTEAAYDALSGTSDRNGRRVGTALSDITRFDYGDQDDPRYSRTRITLIIDGDNRPKVYWNVPELGNARSIICLDAWPSIHEWKMNIGDNLSVEPIITDREFELWRKFERGLEVVQIGDAVRPASTEIAVDNYTDPVKQRIVVESLRARYGSAFSSAIFPNAMEDRMSEILPVDFETLTSGGVTSNNAFSCEPVGLVTNSIDPGDDYVLDLLAARGLDAEPERRECIECPGKECPICGGEPGRKPGRGFVGPDSDAAKEMLAGIRDYGIAQAIGRWARKRESPRALVFVRTSAVPDVMVDMKIPTAWKFTEKQRAVIDYVRENPASSCEDVEMATGVSKETTREVLLRLIECGVAKRGSNPSNPQQHLYLITGEIPRKGILDLSMLE